jgi:hypothetical protein
MLPSAQVIGPVPVQVPTVLVTDTNAAPAGRLYVAVAAMASSGPAFARALVNVSGSLMPTGSGLPDSVTESSEKAGGGGPTVVEADPTLLL